MAFERVRLAFAGRVAFALAFGLRLQDKAFGAFGSGRSGRSVRSVRNVRPAFGAFDAVLGGSQVRKSETSDGVPVLFDLSLVAALSGTGNVGCVTLSERTTSI